MKSEKKYFFTNENVKDLKMSKKQMTKTFGGDPSLDFSDGTHIRTIKYDRYITYTESTYVRF